MSRHSNRFVRGATYYGNKISDYGLENNRVDYGTLAKAFDTVLNNEIYSKISGLGYYWEPYSGNEYYYESSNGDWLSPQERDEYVDELQEELDDLEYESDEIEPESRRYEEIQTRIREINDDIGALEDAHYYDIFQYYIISDAGARVLSEDTDEIVLYNEEFDIYLWCVTHYGTSWDYVLTDIECNVGYEREYEDAR